MSFHSEKMLQHAVSGYDYNESSNNAVSFQREKQDSSCGGRLYGRETHCIQEMNKGLPYAVWGGKGQIFILFSNFRLTPNKMPMRAFLIQARR